MKNRDKVKKIETRNNGVLNERLGFLTVVEDERGKESKMKT